MSAPCDSVRFIAKAVVSAFLLATSIVAWPQQSAPLLQITSPVDSAVVNPGQTLSVVVTSPANASFSEVGVIGEDPIGFGSTSTSVPATLSVSVPTSIACRKFMLTAIGATTSGQAARSATVLIDVERADMPTALSPQIAGVSLEVLGEQFPLVLLAQFSDGSILDVTEASYVTYASANTSVAAVDANGMVTGGSAGSTTITATYTLNGENVQTTVPVTVPPPVMTVNPVSLSFTSQNVGTTSSAQQIMVTNTGTGPLRMLGVSASGDFAETDNCTSSSPLAVNASCAVNVTFTPSSAGSRSGALGITNGFNVVSATLALAGTGIGQPATTTTVASSADPSILASSVTLTATVTPTSGSSTPTGTVTFSDGSTVLASQPLANGQATFTTSSLTIGSHSITATYSGDSNFTGSASTALTQAVQYEPAGTSCGGDVGHQILQPINSAGLSVFKQGQTIPAKLRVCDANGVSIGSASAVSSFALTQITSGTVTTNVQDIVDTNNPDTAFRWDPTDQQWIFNISTQNLAANSTYVYTIILNDGTNISFQYGMR